MHFYVLKPEDGNIFGRKWAYADQLDPVHRGDAPTCPVCGAYVGGREWLPPHYIKLSSAKPDKWGDFLWGAGFDLMVSGFFQQIYESERLNGIAHFYSQATILRTGNKKTGDLPAEPPTYCLVKIKWNGANLDDIASEVVRKNVDCEYDRGGVEKLERISLEPGSWDGSDIFKARGLPGVILVSQRFFEVVQRYNLKNFWLIPAENYAYDVSRAGLWFVKK